MTEGQKDQYQEYEKGDVIVIMDTPEPGVRSLDQVFITGKEFSVASAFEAYREWLKVQVTKEIADFLPWLIDEGYLIKPRKVDIWRS